MLRFTLFGIPVQVQPWFWLTMAFIGGGARANTKEALLLLALFILAGVISILVHELGHALTGRAFGARSAITLQAFGGYAEFSGTRFNRPQQFLVTAAGPFVQIVLGGAIFVALHFLGDLKSEAGYFWVSLAWISIVWAVLNLLPVMPLDGGQMLNAVLGPERIKLTLWITIITAAVAGVAIFQWTGSILFALFMGLFAYQSWQALRQRF